MSNRTLVEINHDFAPGPEQDKLVGWAAAFRLYMQSGDKSQLPYGVTFKARRHHSDPDPMKGKGDPS